MPRSHSYACRNTTERKCIEFHGISKRKEQYPDTREAWESKTQVWKQEFLVPRILCGHRRKEHEKDCRVYSESAQRRRTSRPTDTERIHRPVYG